MKQIMYAVMCDGEIQAALYNWEQAERWDRQHFGFKSPCPLGPHKILKVFVEVPTRKVNKKIK